MIQGSLPNVAVIYFTHSRYTLLWMFLYKLTIRKYEYIIWLTFLFIATTWFVRVKPLAEEQAVVRKECDAIRASINENNQDCRHQGLCSFTCLVTPTHLGQMRMPQTNCFSRIHLGLMLLLEERQKVEMLVIASLKTSHCCIVWDHTWLRPEESC